MKTNRTWVFRIILISIPIVFFVVVEIVLRLIGYGASYPLFIETPDSQNYILGRPDIVKRYFPADSAIPAVTMEASLFLKEKPTDGLRIFVQGGSTAAGFPYGLGAAPAGMLDQRLKQTFPHRHVEVINTAMSAVNSFTLLDFVDEIINQQPDAILIYAGHNEYLGIMGVGSNFSAANSHGINLLFLTIRDLRLFQLLQNIYVKLRSSKPQPANKTTEDGSATGANRTFMSKVAKEKNIAIDSNLYRAGLLQFEKNLTLIIDKYSAAGIPVYIATVASNLRDQQPFVSSPVSLAAKQQLNTVMDLAKDKPSQKILVQQVDEILNQADTRQSADAHFMAAKVLELGVNSATAKPYYIKAKELDLLRIRAPEAINEIINRSAEQNDTDYLVDYLSNLANKSPGGVVGKEFMLEHLHPNLPGYFILADSFYNALIDNSLHNSKNTIVGINQAWKQRPVLPAEEYFGYAQIMQLKSDYPFTVQPIQFVLPKPTDWQQQLGLKRFKNEIDWITMISESYRGYVDERNMPMIMKTAQIIADAVPHNDKANYEYGRLLVQDGRSVEARIYFQRALLEQPDNELYKKAQDVVFNE